MPKFPPLWEVSEEDKEKAKQEMMVAQDRLTLYLPLSIILVPLFPFYWWRSPQVQPLAVLAKRSQIFKTKPIAILIDGPCATTFFRTDSHACLKAS
jgi:hypothetical protein